MSLCGQTDTAKRYIEKLIIKSELKFSTISVSLQNNTSKISSVADTLLNVAFYKNDKVTLKIQLDKFEVELDGFNTYFQYCDFTYQVEIFIDKQKTQCTQFMINDSRGNQYGSLLNCPEKTDAATPQNYIAIWTIGNINPDQKIYHILQH